ncbi:hypothetical protein GA0116948_10161 [Chitinophaga costaii]|uniref:Uncharacterized protein n=1 Tax=Chitinophaga costaii TaxID=1335309 RepID=A0A1C3YR80_9BACT|nr:hypothetical protein [Chitinophaga costaii]PUZ30067.1 hypothetical protein DCM91_00890 [Chitinophaga costaii]SCB72597.1 hypothetical protein GA0116948_10161 [Chitinophaga costaii]
MTTAAYDIVKKELLKKKAQVKASPAAAKKVLVESGLWNLLKDDTTVKPPKSRDASQVPPTKKHA